MQYSTEISWSASDKEFTPKTYDRTHHIAFPGGIKVEASSAPEFLGNAQFVNPEELFIASLSSCFMLTFLYLASLKGYTIEKYTAKGIGILGKNAEGKMAMTKVSIHPDIKFADQVQVSVEELTGLFKKAHDQCFISCSVRTEVVIEG